jgi:hypothetical protein
MKRVNMMYALICLVFCLLLISNVSAATINAASCSQSNVQTAINSASTGDTVAVPSGSCSWTSTITLNKNIILQGSGSSSTYISGGSISSTNSAPRITGFHFTGTTIGIYEGTAGTSNGWRIDHNTFVWSGSDATINIRGNVTSTSLTHPTGLIDNNHITGGQILIFGDMATGPSNGDDMWYLSDSLGAGTNVVYIEDNTFTYGSHLPYMVDSNYGGRYVLRYNNITNRSMEHHGIQSIENRGVSRYEIYNNTWNNSPTYWGALYIRSGGGLVFNNTASGYNNFILIDNQTSCRYGEYPADSRSCNGLNPRDGNRSGMHGYPCRDQIGRGRDIVKGHVGDTQILSPLYSWNNKLGGVEKSVTITWDVDCSRNTEHLQANRDFYNGASGNQVSKTSPFNGTSGVGYGTLANRPDICTTNSSESGGGVAYWATDTNTLYRCSATNTWTIYYTPYTYPHPLRGGASTTIQPPRNVRIN